MDKERIKGFVLSRAQEIAELEGCLYEYVHEKTGARLLYLATEDKNKLFSVSFATTPSDDTGVFHILEHSVLCGSDKYPVREPFVELLKSSMNTFLNALTFPDKTMYPVASRNEKDFFNLMSVYLDAVFHPAIYSNPSIFRQEGWYYDAFEDGSYRYKGVVFNEMKGAESSVETLINNELMRMLYPDTCYSAVSGGDPRYITDLSYEQFLDCHRKYYSPANAIFYLEGKLDLERCIDMIEAAMPEQAEDCKAAFIESQSVIPAESTEAYYAISPEESTKEMTHIALGRIIADFDEKEKLFATSLLCEYLTDSNEAPLAQAILENNLAQNVQVQMLDGIRQPYIYVEFENTEAERLDAIMAAVESLRARYAEEGISAEELEPTLNSMEFALREGMEPRGLLHNIMALNSYLYGGDPALYLTYNESFDFLREKLGTDYYKELLLELLDFSSYSRVIMKPSTSKGAEDEADEAQRVAARVDAWSDEEKAEHEANIKALRKWQGTEDTPEQLATIPKLAKSDVDLLPEDRPTKPGKYGKATILEHPFGLDGISYVNMYFAFPAKYADRLSELSLIAELLGDLPTEDRSLFDLMQDIKMNLGSLAFSTKAFARDGNADETDVYLTVSMSALSSKLPEARRIVEEILYRTDFSARGDIEQNLVQIQNEYRDSIIQSGNKMGIRRLCADLTSVGCASDRLAGFSFYQRVKQINENFEEAYASILEMAQVLRQEILTQSGMFCSITGPSDELDVMKSIIDLFPAGEDKATSMSFEHKAGEKTMIKIPAGITYAVAGSNLGSLGERVNGRWKVASKIIALEYLWQEVRVKGGAYGCSLSLSGTGNVVFSSYRDPGAEKTYDVYAKTGDFLRKFAAACDTESYIISAVADTEPLIGARENGTLADFDWAEGRNFETRCTLRREMLETESSDLISIADALDSLWQNENFCLVASDKGSFQAENEASV